MFVDLFVTGRLGDKDRAPGKTTADSCYRRVWTISIRIVGGRNVDILLSPASANIVKCPRCSFATCGSPKCTVTDDGAPFSIRGVQNVSTGKQNHTSLCRGIMA